MNLNEKNILVTVIVPIYNIENYVARCIESILMQTYVNLEILLVNDGSKDRSRDICLEYAKKDSRIRIIDKENGGLSDARNKGIEEARGDYYVFIDGDDYIKRRYVELLVENIIETGSDVSICAFDVVDDKGNLIKKETLNEKTGTVNGHDILSAVMTDYGYKYVVAWNKIYSKNVFDILRFDTGKIYEDEYINFRLFWNCKKVGIINIPLYCYVQRYGSITKSAMSLDKIQIKCEMHRTRIMFYDEKGDSELYKNACQMYCNWLVECVRKHFDILPKKERIILQKNMRKYALQALDSKLAKTTVKIQDIIGFFSLSLAAKIKDIYMNKYRD